MPAGPGGAPAPGERLPAESRPPGAAGAEYKAFADTTRFADANAAEFGATPATDAQVRAAGSLGARPLVVLTATEHGGGVAGAAAADQTRQLEQQWQGWQRELAGLSSDRLHRVVDGASHASLQLQQRHAAVTSAAIEQVVVAVRTGQPLVP